MISEKAVKIHVEFYSFLYRIEVDETSLREFAAKLQGGMGNTAKRWYFLVLQGVRDALDDAAKVTLR